MVVYWQFFARYCNGCKGQQSAFVAIRLSRVHDANTFARLTSGGYGTGTPIHIINNYRPSFVIGDSDLAGVVMLSSE